MQCVVVDRATIVNEVDWEKILINIIKDVDWSKVTDYVIICLIAMFFIAMVASVLATFAMKIGRTLVSRLLVKVIGCVVFITVMWSVFMEYLMFRTVSNMFGLADVLVHPAQPPLAVLIRVDRIGFTLTFIYAVYKCVVTHYVQTYKI